MEAIKQKTWKPTVAGIIDIVVGASGLVLVIFLIIGIMITGGVFDIPGIEAVEVAKVITQALISKKPKAQYLVGPGALKMKKLAGLPVKLRDLMMYKAVYK